MRNILLALLLATISVAGNAATENQHQKDDDDEQTNMLVPLKPTYINTYSNPWNSNWFIGIQGGATTFVGTPIGCGDLFDHITPALKVNLGKWFTPAIGGRIAYQGLTFKNAELQKMDYQFVHADFRYNLTSNCNQNEYGQSRFDVIPFVGVGMIHNSTKSPTDDGGNHPFALSYGIQLRYLLTSRLHLVGEISGMTTMRNFDCVGTESRFGDHMITASLGLSFTIGKRGWAKVIDAKPYIAQNNYLLDKYTLLENYRQSQKKENDSISVKGKNDYSGLNSLRYRISMNQSTASAGANGNGSETENADSTNTTNQIIGINVPIYFYFQLNTNHLVNKSQLANLDEIARLAKEQSLIVHITGAADSATGTQKINRGLSTARARYIAKELMKRGIKKENIKANSIGGISQFNPKEANRFSVVLLSLSQ